MNNKSKNNLNLISLRWEGLGLTNLELVQKQEGCDE